MSRPRSRPRPRSSSPSPAAAPSPSTAAIERWRADIDLLDAELVALLARRTRLSVRVARWKRRSGLPLHTPAREAVILERVRRQARGPLTPSAARRIFRAILAEMRALQARHVAAAGARARGAQRDW